MADEVRVHCPRLERLRTISDHLECPYCFGSASDVASGARRRYCGFERGVDPVVFGFPEHLSRRRRG